MSAVSARPGIRWRHGQRGVALLEFVIVFPLLVTLVFSIWEAGRIFDAWLISTNAAREGARYAVEWNPALATSTCTDEKCYVQNKVMAYLNSGYGARLSPTGGDVTIKASDISVTTTTTGSGPVTVAVTAHVEVFAPTPFSAGFLGPDGKFAVHAWTTMYQ